MKAKRKISFNIILSALCCVLFAFYILPVYSAIVATLNASSASPSLSVNAYNGNQQHTLINETITIPFIECSTNREVAIEYSYFYDFDVRLTYSLSWSGGASVSTDNVILHFADRDSWIVDNNYIYRKDAVEAGTGKLVSICGIEFTDPQDETYIGQTLTLEIEQVKIVKANYYTNDLSGATLVANPVFLQAGSKASEAFLSYRTSDSYLMIYNNVYNFETGISHPLGQTAYRKTSEDSTHTITSQNVDSVNWLGGNRTYSGLGMYVVANQDTTLSVSVEGAWYIDPDNEDKVSAEDKAAVYINNIQFNYSKDWSINNGWTSVVVETKTFNQTIKSGNACYIDILDSIEINSAAISDETQTFSQFKYFRVIIDKVIVNGVVYKFYDGDTQLGKNLVTSTDTYEHNSISESCEFNQIVNYENLGLDLKYETGTNKLYYKNGSTTIYVSQDSNGLYRQDTSAYIYRFDDYGMYVAGTSPKDYVYKNYKQETISVVNSSVYNSGLYSSQMGVGGATDQTYKTNVTLINNTNYTQQISLQNIGLSVYLGNGNMILANAQNNQRGEAFFNANSYYYSQKYVTTGAFEKYNLEKNSITIDPYGSVQIISSYTVNRYLAWALSKTIESMKPIQVEIGEGVYETQFPAGEDLSEYDKYNQSDVEYNEEKKGQLYYMDGSTKVYLTNEKSSGVYLTEYYDCWVGLNVEVEDSQASIVNTKQDVVNIVVKQNGNQYSFKLINNSANTLTNIKLDIKAYDYNLVYTETTSRPKDWKASFWKYYTKSGETYTQIANSSTYANSWGSNIYAGKWTYSGIDEINGSQTNLLNFGSMFEYNSTDQTFVLKSNNKILPNETVEIFTLTKTLKGNLVVDSKVESVTATNNQNVMVVNNVENPYLKNNTQNMYLVRIQADSVGSEIKHKFYKPIGTTDNYLYYMGILRPDQVLKLTGLSNYKGIDIEMLPTVNGTTTLTQTFLNGLTDWNDSALDLIVSILN